MVGIDFLSMFDWTRILPLLAFWSCFVFVAYLCLKHHFIPEWIAEAIAKAPLDAEAVVNALEIKELNDEGFHLSINTTVRNTKLPMQNLCIQLSIPAVRVYISNHLVAIAKLSNPLRIDGERDLEIDQHISVDLCHSVCELKPILKRFSILGKKEMDRLVFRIEFSLSINIMNTIRFESIPCSKLIRVSELQSRPVESKLLPKPKLTPFVHPRLRSMEAGLHIEFDKVPELRLSLGKVSFRALLNGSSVADCVVTGVNMASTMKIVFEITPLHGRAILSPFHVSKGIVKGAISGIANGLLYGDWGGQVLVIGMKNLSFENQDSKRVWWLDELFQGIELEHDLDAVRKVKARLDQKTTDFSEALVNMTLMVLTQKPTTVE
jgi:hypothetical protein